MTSKETWNAPLFFCTAVCLLLAGCHSLTAPMEPAIIFTKLPAAGEGSSDGVAAIEGRATGVKPGERIVLYASSGDWWIQPTEADPFTTVQADSSWKSQTHPGSAYAALLVRADYHPRLRIDVLPEKGGPVLAVALADGRVLRHDAGKTVVFGGYEWQKRETSYSPGGSRNDYSAENVRVDEKGFLHLRITGEPNQWTSAEVKLTRSLGYGSYRFVVQDISHFEPAAVFVMLTRNDDSPPREMDIEISKWGETEALNGQFVIQPYYVPANTIQFRAPAGPVTFMLRWTPGRAWFRVFAGVTSRWESKAIWEHAFTSGVPPAGNESVHLNLYAFSNDSNPMRHGTEVVVENFEYLP